MISFKTFSNLCSLDPQTKHEPLKHGISVRYWPVILGSCNDILLLQSLNALCFWNPLTRKQRPIAVPDRFRPPLFQGFGYDPSRNDFKVVVIVKNEGSTYVFSFVSSSWKRINDSRYYGYFSADYPEVVLNGSPHWIVCPGSERPKSIAYFDSCEETFRELPLWSYLCEETLFPDEGLCRLAVLGGNLCGVNNNNVDRLVDVWVLKELSWSKLFSLPYWQDQEFSAQVGWCFLNMFTPLCYVGDEGDPSCEAIVVQLNSRALALYNFKDNRYERIKFPRDSDGFHVACYVKTLASP